MPEYELTYFNVRAMAEPIRFLFAFAEVPYEDKRISFEEWHSNPTLKSTLGYGKLPILKIDGKDEICQSGAIGRYLAHKHNLAGSNPLEFAWGDEIIDTIGDISSLWRPYMWMKDEVKKEETKKMILGYIDRSLTKFADRIEKNTGSDFLIGKSVTLADLWLASYVEIWAETVDSSIYDRFPVIKKHKETIFKLPQIAKWVAKRPKTPA